MSRTVEFLASVLCDVCSNAEQGVKADGKRLCLSCLSDDVELVAEVVRFENAERLER